MDAITQELVTLESAAMDPGPDPRVWRTIKCGALRADLNGQRQRKADDLKFILREFRWERFETLTVVDNGDGTYNVIEGQGRWFASRELFGPDFEVPCMVLPQHTTIAEQAVVARKIDATRKKMTVIDQWRLDASAGDPYVLAANKVLAERGLRIGDPKVKTQAAPMYTLKCAGTIRRIMTGGRREPQESALILDWTAQVIQAAYPADGQSDAKARWDGYLVAGIADLIARNSQPENETTIVNLDRLSERLGAYSPSRLVKNGKESSESISRYITELLRTSYNKQLRKGQLK